MDRHDFIKAGVTLAGSLIVDCTATLAKLALAGPFANDKGGLFVNNAASKEEALSYLNQDPFAVEGVFADSAPRMAHWASTRICSQATTPHRPEYGVESACKIGGRARRAKSQPSRKHSFT